MRRRLRRGPLFLLAVLAAALVAAALAGCATSSSVGSASSDPLVGYWVSGGTGSQMTLVQIQKNGDSYKVLANPDVPAGHAKKKSGTLVIASQVVKLTFSPQPADKLALEFSGDMFQKPVTVTLSRTDQNGYADAAAAYGLVAIRRGLDMWKAGGAKEYPPPGEVTPSGPLAKLIRWPTNMFTGQPMQPGTRRGDYTYTQLDGGKSYSLVAYLPDGSTIGK